MSKKSLIRRYVGESKTKEKKHKKSQHKDNHTEELKKAQKDQNK